MNVSQFLVLGSLEILGKASGYDILTELERKKVTKWTNIKKGSLYFALKQLLEKKHIEEIQTEKSGLYPVKTIYGITETGRSLFDSFQEKAFLGLYPFYYGFKLALKFNIRRTPEELKNYGRLAMERIDKILSELDLYLASPSAIETDFLFIEHEKMLFMAEKEWIRKAVDY